ncbi:unnamed protein product, partial [Allacma fusca]
PYSLPPPPVITRNNLKVGIKNQEPVGSASKQMAEQQVSLRGLDTHQKLVTALVNQVPAASKEEASRALQLSSGNFQTAERLLKIEQLVRLGLGAKSNINIDGTRDCFGSRWL